jgi:hypothetical protein
MGSVTLGLTLWPGIDAKFRDGRLPFQISHPGPARPVRSRRRRGCQSDRDPCRRVTVGTHQSEWLGLGSIKEGSRTVRLSVHAVLPWQCDETKPLLRLATEPQARAGCSDSGPTAARRARAQGPGAAPPGSLNFATCQLQSSFYRDPGLNLQSHGPGRGGRRRRPGVTAWARRTGRFDQSSAVGCGIEPVTNPRYHSIVLF